MFLRERLAIKNDSCNSKCEILKFEHVNAKLCLLNIRFLFLKFKIFIYKLKYLTDC